MNTQIINENNSFNKKVFFLAILIGLLVNFAVVYMYGYFISSVPKLSPAKNPTVKFIEIKEKPKPKKIKKKKIKKRINKKVAKKHKKKKSLKTSAKKHIEKKVEIPIATPILPEVSTLEEKEIKLSENQVDIASIPENEPSLEDIKVFKPVLKGEFNPKFGVKLKKFDETAFGTAAGRLVVYKPPPPKIKTKLPPPPKIKVKLWINPDGTVDKVEIVYPKAIGDIKLKQQIQSYVLSWKFNPISSNERQWAVTTIRFKPVH